MNHSLALDERQFAAAMSMLERAQKELLPSRAEIRRYQYFNVANASVAILFGLWFLNSHRAEWLLAPLAVAAVIDVVLFVLNFGLIRKLWRSVRLRQRLGLARSLAPYFKEKRGLAARVVRSAARVLWMLFGLLVLGFCVYVMADDNTPLTYALPIAGMAFLLAASLLILPFMWTASRRQRIVAGLHASLSLAGPTGSDDGQAGEFAAAATRVLGEMERFHIMNERRKNLEQAERDTLAEYSVQQSVEVHRTRAELDADSARKVEAQMLALAENPFPDDATEDEKTGMKMVQVLDTALEVGYTVDPETRSIKVFYLRAADGPGGGAPANA